MNAGFLLIDKPPGKTSHDVVAAARRALGIRRIGHTGTLDPFATGLLPVLIGSATRLARFLSGLDKTYEAVFRLGERTDSGDATGTVEAQSDAWQALTDAQVRTAMTGLTGSVRQRPPILSAKKIAGIPAHRRVRRGESVDLPEVDVTIRTFDLVDRRGSDLTIRTTVSSGTYIRSLARDLGDALGCGAHVTELRRVAVGPFDIGDAVPLVGLAPDAVLPVERALTHLTAVTVDQDGSAALVHGRAVVCATRTDAPVAIMGPDGLIGVGEVHGERLQPRVVLTPC